MHHVIYFSALITQYIDVARPLGPNHDVTEEDVHIKFSGIKRVLNDFNLQLEAIQSI